MSKILDSSLFMLDTLQNNMQTDIRTSSLDPEDFTVVLWKFSRKLLRICADKIYRINQYKFY